MEHKDLIDALISGNQQAAVQFIKDVDEPGKVEIDDLSGNGRTYFLVHVAAFTGQAEVMNCLISKGVDLNAKEPTHKGWTALHFVSQHRHVEVARLLLSNGADPSIQDTDGKTPLDFAHQHKHYDIAELIEK